MKKGLVIVLAILAVFAMVSCKNDPVASDGANIFVKGGLIFVEFDEPQEIALAKDYNANLFWTEGSGAGALFILGEDGLPILKDNMEDTPGDLNHYYAKNAYLVLEPGIKYHLPLYSLGSDTLFIANTDVLLDIFDNSTFLGYDENWGLSCKASLYYNGGKSLTIQTIEMTDVSKIEATYVFETNSDLGFTGDVEVVFHGLGDGEYQFTTDTGVNKYYIPIEEEKVYVMTYADKDHINVIGYKDGKLNASIDVDPVFDGDLPSLTPSKITAKLTNDAAEKFVLVESEEMELDYTYEIEAEPRLNGLKTYSIKLADITFNIKNEEEEKGKERTAVALLGGIEGDFFGIIYEYELSIFNRDNHGWTVVDPIYQPQYALRYNWDDVLEQTPLFTKKLAENIIAMGDENIDLARVTITRKIKATVGPGLVPVTLPEEVVYFHLEYPTTP